jgi:hypothetical protein
MQMQQTRSRYWQSCFTLFLFVVAASAFAWGGKDKSKPASSKAAPATHTSSSGTASHGSSSGGRSSGSSGRTSGSGYTKSSGGSATGKPSGARSSHNASSSGATGRPASTTGHASVSGNPGHPGSNSNSKSGSRSGHVYNNAGNGKTSNGSGHNNGHDSPRDSRNTHSADKHEPGRNGHSGESVGHNKYQPVRHVSEEHGHHVARDENNRVREIRGHDSRGRDFAVRHDVHGGARFETRGPGGRRIVGYGNGRGFTERRYINRGGRVYVQRTYIYGGRRYAYAYRSYYYHGYAYYGYAPAFYYRPAFYGWAYSPWAAPVVFHWGWYRDPWYAAYGYYYTPYPVYASASLWLTDYLLAENLRAAYDARANAEAAAAVQDAEPAQPGGQAALSPEVKQMIAEEVKRQLDADRAAAAQPASESKASTAQGGNNQPEETPAALDPNQQIFIVAGNLDLVGESGECTVTAGDVLMRIGTTPDENNRLAMRVASSKKGDCPVNTNSDVDVSELQEMHNQFREKLDTGLKALADNAGKDGLPKAPDTTTTAGEVPAPQPDTDAEGELQNQQKDAEGAEREVQKGAPGGK